MAPVNRISAVDIGTYKESFTFVCAEDIGLVCAGMRSQNRRLVHIICICFAPARMVCRKSQRVKVLVCGYHGEECIVVFVCGWWEAGFNDGARNRNGVIFLNMETARDCSINTRGEIVPFVGGVGFAIYGNRAWYCSYKPFSETPIKVQVTNLKNYTCIEYRLAAFSR